MGTGPKRKERTGGNGETSSGRKRGAGLRERRDRSKETGGKKKEKTG